mmetsp:Transcript_17284/g.41892  ORF Transcript_17284/g.41892 Transcript_17284/m.41892 type:complete len:403 (-) Transcript_17284:1291-2499(-)
MVGAPCLFRRIRAELRHVQLAGCDPVQVSVGALADPFVVVELAVVIRVCVRVRVFVGVLVRSGRVRVIIRVLARILVRLVLTRVLIRLRFIRPRPLIILLVRLVFRVFPRPLLLVLILLVRARLLIFVIVRVTQLLVLARRASALLRRQLAQLVDASSELQDRACSLRVRPLRPPPPTLDVFIQRQPQVADDAHEDRPARSAVHVEALHRELHRLAVHQRRPGVVEEFFDAEQAVGVARADVAISEQEVVVEVEHAGVAAVAANHLQDRSALARRLVAQGTVRSAGVFLADVHPRDLRALSVHRFEQRSAPRVLIADGIQICRGKVGAGVKECVVREHAVLAVAVLGAKRILWKGRVRGEERHPVVAVSAHQLPPPSTPVSAQGPCETAQGALNGQTRQLQL